MAWAVPMLKQTLRTSAETRSTFMHPALLRLIVEARTAAGIATNKSIVSGGGKQGASVLDTHTTIPTMATPALRLLQVCQMPAEEMHSGALKRQFEYVFVCTASPTQRYGRFHTYKDALQQQHYQKLEARLQHKTAASPATEYA